MTSLTPVDLFAAAAVIGFTLGFSQALVKNLRRWFRRYRRAHHMGPAGGGYQPHPSAGKPNPPPEAP